MAHTADVKEELARVEVSRTTVRAAEVATILRFAGGLHVISGRIAVEAELDSPQVARRVRKDLAELYGARSDVSVIAATGLRRTSHYLVRIHEAGETLARQTGLMDARRRPVRGLPNRLTTGSRDDLAAIWRGAFLAQGTLTDPGPEFGRSPRLPGLPPRIRRPGQSSIPGRGHLLSRLRAEAPGRGTRAFEAWPDRGDGQSPSRRKDRCPEGNRRLSPGLRRDLILRRRHTPEPPTDR